MVDQRQIAAINSCTKSLGALIRTVIGDKIKHVSGILQDNELPEKMLVVEYGSEGDCLLVVTNVRFMRPYVLAR